MADDYLNSTRAGRSIENLDRPKNTAIDPGQDDAHGRKMPRYKDDIIVEETKDALDRSGQRDRRYDRGRRGSSDREKQEAVVSNGSQTACG